MNSISIDNFTIISSLALLLLSIVTPMLNPFFRFRRKDCGPMAPGVSEPSPLPPLSLVLTPFDDAEGLAKHLPHILRQDYPAGLQVIVVVEQDDHRAEEIVSSVHQAYLQECTSTPAQLYVTHIPQSSRYVSRKKLAITLGIKAALHEWVVLTETSCCPASPHWLSTLGIHCNDATTLVVGYGCYDDETPAYRRFERLHTAFYLMREHRRGSSYRDNSRNLILRKSEFMNGDGYLGNLHLARGEFDFLVNKYGGQGNAVLATAEEGWMIEESPARKSWVNEHLYYLESRKFLLRSFRHRLLYNTDQSFLHLNLLLQLGGLVLGALCQNWVVLTAAVLSLLITMVFRYVLCRRALRSFGENMSALAAVCYEPTLLWHNIGYMLRYRRADKHDFTTHKL